MKETNNKEKQDNKAYCETCRYYKQSFLVPCEGKCKVLRVKRFGDSNVCTFYEKEQKQL